MNGYSSLKTRACPYDTININEMALVVYNATLNPDQRKEAEMMFGSQLKEKWYKLNEYCDRRFGSQRRRTAGGCTA